MISLCGGSKGVSGRKVCGEDGAYDFIISAEVVYLEDDSLQA